MTQNTKQIVKKFTPKESFDILKNLIVGNKATQDTYTLILLWLTGLLNRRNHAHLRSVAGGNIIATDIRSNSDELIELVHEIMIELMYSKINYGGKGIGLKYKVRWDDIPTTNKVTGELELKPIQGNEGRVVAFIYTAFKNILFKALGKNYRGEISYSNLYNIKKHPDMIKLRERIERETDTGATTPELIAKLKGEGFFPGVHPESGESIFDIKMYQYRNIFSLGYWRNYTELTEEIDTKGSIIREVTNLTSPDNYKKFLYEQILLILNSTKLPKLNREFLKCYYGIPTVVELYEKKIIYVPDMVLFFEMYPDYRKVLKVRRISYSGKRRNVKWIDNISIVEQSRLYKESSQMLKHLLTPILDYVHQKYQDDLEMANELRCAYTEYLSDIGGDMQFSDMTNMGIGEVHDI